ncbi:MAG: beta-galactosidase trimerization domain-containing protein [Clostridia bacterium]|nr:beta-galactosidase trimerization domain-containing protein [Clostridia bacterium]
MNPWKERFAWFWYNDDEIFRYSDEDFDKKASEFAHNGVTTVITFSVTHFRWDYEPWWDHLLDVLRRIVNACHKYGIKVVEHHSAQLTRLPKDENEWKLVEYSYEMRHSSIDSWPGIRERFSRDPDEFRPWRQIDGRNGEPVRSNYMGLCMCFNNPDFRAAYQAYMKRVLETGVDGVMDDDVQYFGQGCVCEHCRRLFREETGYEIPDPEHWTEFWGNNSDPVYIAFRRFRLNSTTRFQHDMQRYYESLGYHPSRPNYISGILSSNWSSYCFETGKDLWTHVFQENYVSSIRHLSYPNYAMEMLQRTAMGKRTGIPSMSLFYPEKEDDYYFTWALTRVWGQLFLATRERGDLNELEYKYRSFESAHESSFIAPEHLADMGVYQSSQTRDYAPEASKHVNAFLSWMEAAYMSGISLDMVFEDDNDEILAQYPVLLVSHTAMMSQEELDRLHRYAENGGRLILAGRCGIYRPDGSPRSDQETADALGLTGIRVRTESRQGCGVFRFGDQTIPQEDVRADLAFEGGETLMTLDGAAVAVRQQLGKGDLFWLPDLNGCPLTRTPVSDVRQPVRQRANVEPSPVPMMRRTVGTVLNSLLCGRVIRAESSEELLSSVFRTDPGWTAHLLNISGTIPTEPCTAGHEDILPNFTGKNRIPEPIRLTLTLPGSEPSAAVLYTPEREDAVPLTLHPEGDAVVTEIPGGTFGGYAMIVLK